MYLYTRVYGCTHLSCKYLYKYHICVYDSYIYTYVCMIHLFRYLHIRMYDSFV